MLLNLITVLKILIKLVEKISSALVINRKIVFLEYTRECAYDEPLLDTTLNHPTECDTLGRCPMNSYCNTQTNRCCVKGREVCSLDDMEYLNFSDYGNIALSNVYDR